MNPAKVIKHITMRHFRFLSIAVPLILIFWGSLVFYKLPDTTSADQRYITISTDSIAILPPHTHPREAQPTEHGVWKSGSITINEDIWVNSFSLAVESNPPAGKTQDKNPLHNISIEKVGTPDNWCPTENELIFGSGSGILTQSNGVQNMPEPYAIFLPKGTELQIKALWHNQLSHSLKNVRASVRLSFIPAKDMPAFAAAKLAVITPAGCDGRMVGHITVPPYTKNFNARTTDLPFIFQRDGKIVILASHFHPDEEGKKLRLLINRRVIYEFIPKLFSFSERDQVYFPKDGIPVQAGDTLVLESLYDNSSTTPNGNAMVIAGFYFAEK